MAYFEGYKERLRDRETLTPWLEYLMLLIVACSGWISFKEGQPFLGGVIFGIFLGRVLSLLADYRRESFLNVKSVNGVVAPTTRNNFDILAKHGLRAHYYLPAAGVEDSELASALREVNSNGYIITDVSGNQLIGKVALMPMTSNERAEIRRSDFKVVRPIIGEGNHYYKE